MTPENPSKGISLDELESNEQLLNRTNYLLAIGIDDYQHLPKLYNCIKDVNDLISVLTEKYFFEKKNITTVFNAKATRANIFRALRNLATRITPSDNLIIYFSGHGEYDKVMNQGYWIPIDARQGEYSEYISGSDLKMNLNAINSHHTFLISDSCFSGSLFTQHSGKNISKRYENDPSRWGLTAGRNEIVSDGKPGDNSPFAEALLGRLRNSRHPMGVLELCFHIIEELDTHPHLKQTPVWLPLNVDGHKNGQFVFHQKENIATKEWEIVKQKNNVTDYKTFLANFPKSDFSAEAKKKIELLKTSVSWEEIQKMPENTYDEVNKKLFFVKEYTNQFQSADNHDFAIKLQKFLEEKESRLKPKSPVTPTTPSEPKPPSVKPPTTNTGTKTRVKKPTGRKKPPISKPTKPKPQPKKENPLMLFLGVFGNFVTKNIIPIIVGVGALVLIAGGIALYKYYEYDQKIKRERQLREIKEDITWNRIKTQNNLDSVKWYLTKYPYGKNKAAAGQLQLELKKKKTAENKKSDGQKFYDEMMNKVSVKSALSVFQVDQLPVFSGCDNIISSSSQKRCSDKKLIEFIKKNVKTPRLFKLSSYDEKKVEANFVIEENGSVSNIMFEDDEEPYLKEEVKRLLNLMPKWTPAKKDGKSTRVQMKLPIRFVNSNKASNQIVAALSNKTGGSIGSGEFKAQQGVRPIFKNNASKKVNCKTLGFTLKRHRSGTKNREVINIGAKYGLLARDLVSDAQKGDVYTFDVIKIKCDGESESRKLEDMVFKIK